jgi:hypothetical protein
VRAESTNECVAHDIDAGEGNGLVLRSFAASGGGQHPHDEKKACDARAPDFGSTKRHEEIPLVHSKQLNRQHARNASS